MGKTIISFLFLMFVLVLQSQESRLPADLRQHNLTTYNSSLFNPAYSVDRNNANSLAYWVRWQWQTIDGNPTTQFINYTRKLNTNSAVGAAFFQQNTGIYFDTGGVINYAYSFDLNETVKLSVGANVFGFKQSLADDRFIVDPDFPLPQSSSVDDFILQMAPGVNLSVERLTLGFASENLFDYNFTEKEVNTEKEDKVYMGAVSYDFPVSLGAAMNAFVRPSMYLRTIPGQANQIGFNALLNTNKYWGQLGFNNFYGYGVGVGGTFFNHVSLGALVEFGADSSVSTESSFELMAAYFFGKPEERHKMVGSVVSEENELEQIESAAVAKAEAEEEKNKEALTEELEKTEELAEESKSEEKLAKKQEKERRKLEKAAQDSIAKAEKETALALNKEEKRLQKELEEQMKVEEALAKATEKEAMQQKDEMAQKAKAAELAKIEEAEQATKLDVINKAKQEEALAAAQKIKEAKEKAEAAAAAAAVKSAQEKVAQETKLVQQEEVITPLKGEKYEEVQAEAGLEPGYYLIANVFGTKKYFDAFVADLERKGLQPDSFIRSKNKFHYVYLNRFDTMGQARNARDSNFDGKFSGKTWIFRVVGK
ncbi:PorP/SprF family type IX secretion system membrane protein [Zobellia barbeyronii]|uniref:PorP/SprF family type IX secretion system membrane protein n=1 Tax=Zobellia barbeyronii TaxID=2748009 RepID=A0ABS5WC37_9FLAO|nr:PorP/SprF family type IX secretion system membrane protein [Zobellia barbeyronii]MBT2160968.1 PorP/SprF family type IX secretion system membrane protein [Zobellia barbeyronii]